LAYSIITCAIVSGIAARSVASTFLVQEPPVREPETERLSTEFEESDFSMYRSLLVAKGRVIVRAARNAVYSPVRRFGVFAGQES
jgi:hypothetical protein